MRLNTGIIKAATADYFGIDHRIMDYPTRKSEIVITRQIAHYLASDHKTGTLGQIGHEIGDKDHATVLYGIKAVQNYIDTNYRYKGILVAEIVTEIESMILERVTPPKKDIDCWFLFTQI